MTDIDRRRLTKAPLALVAFQVNFSDIDRRLLGKEVMKFRSSLPQGDYGELTQVRRNQVTLQVGTIGSTQASELSSSNGWRFATRDQSWSLTLFQDSLILEAHAQAYGDWASGFRPRLDAGVSALGEIFHPELETRLGLRYNNALSNPLASAPSFWQGRLEPAFLGALGDARLGQYFRGSAQRISFEFEDALATVNVAFQPDAVIAGNTAVVFDADVYCQDPQEFSVERILSVADRLNMKALFMFQCIVSSSQLDELR
jgi:uncharacterized protein (TIGR04255 family)